MKENDIAAEGWEEKEICIKGVSNGQKEGDWVKQYRELMFTVGVTVLLTSAFPLGLRHCFILLCFKAPLVFVIMSGRKTTDYQKVRQVFNRVQLLLP